MILPAAVFAAAAIAAAPDLAPNAHQIALPPEIRQQYRNTDGSCVQCSIGMCGAASAVPAAARLLWTTTHGPAERGGATPDRVRAYCAKRAIPAWHVTGTNTVAWITWALATGRPVAVTYGRAHMVTALGISDDHRHIAICDNNSPTHIEWISIDRFRALHTTTGGGWCVILDAPPAAGPASYRRWWETP